MIEVTHLLSPHLAEARIVEDDLSNPLMPGDQIFSPSWEPGRAEHFALAGFIDIDGDGNSDRQRVHDLIALNGGVIDEEVDRRRQASRPDDDQHQVSGAAAMSPRPTKSDDRSAAIARSTARPRRWASGSSASRNS